MTDTGPPTTELRYTVDLTHADLDGLNAFLSQRLRAQRAAHPDGSAEHRTASGLLKVV
ncbi:hypothetical protein [Kitasatospora camelliae]|uniref:Uncharacterized protein n=1 Tax=Kitasatospora camelliae TaxID=3156397 RepID=A0AAU8K7Y8_9ACTN